MGREVDEQVMHDHIVRLLQYEYYNYPSLEHPYLLTYANHPEKTRAVLTAEKEELFPDIVVIQPDLGTTVLIAEVETESRVNLEEAEEWRRFSGLGTRFYLCVPRERAVVADSLCKAIRLTELVEYYREGKRYVMRRYR